MSASKTLEVGVEVDVVVPPVSLLLLGGGGVPSRAVMPN